MKRVEPRKAEDARTVSRPIRDDGDNGHHLSELTEADLSAILAGLQSMRDGDFSFRLPGAWTGLGGKIADCFNEIIISNERMAQELKRVGHVVGKEGKIKER